MCIYVKFTCANWIGLKKINYFLLSSSNVKEVFLDNVTFKACTSYL